MLNIEQLLSNGERLILFPEGTTSLNNLLKILILFFSICNKFRVQNTRHENNIFLNKNIYNDIAYVENVSFLM